MKSHEEYQLLRELLEVLKEKEPLPWQDWMDVFLADLERNHGNASIAIDLSVKSRDTVYKYRRRNPEFARRWAAVIQAVALEPGTHRSPRRIPKLPRSARPCSSNPPPRRRHRPNLRKPHRRQR